MAAPKHLMLLIKHSYDGSTANVRVNPSISSENSHILNRKFVKAAYYPRHYNMYRERIIREAIEQFLSIKVENEVEEEKEYGISVGEICFGNR